jgi:peptidoglycan/xylan/chitin deacetylase (PgdA/CDA1 family)
MRIRGMGRLRRVGSWIGNRLGSRALILLYHRVVDSESPDPFLLSVTPQRFAEQIAILRERGPLMTLHQLSQALRDGKLTRRASVITFDDGYANNAYCAKPLLERYDVPATVFVTTGYVDRNREFWWDELERLLLQPGKLPETLELRVNGTRSHWELGDAAVYKENDYSRQRSWSVQQEEPGPRQRLYRSLYQLLRPLADNYRRELLDTLASWAGHQTSIRRTHRALSTHEVVELARGDLVEIGAHTVTHPALAELSLAAQRIEIQESKKRLEEILGHTVMSFAYPFGSRRHYTPETAAIVQELGFSSACAGFPGLVGPGSDCFQLPRCVMRNWNGDDFAKRLGEWYL